MSRPGGVRGAIARLAENAYARLDPAQRESARRILLRLADHGDGEVGGTPARRSWPSSRSTATSGVAEVAGPC